ncbi:hypothetical protein IAT38_000238 [Cryptococcus sp. DSM 104549]
MSRHNHYYHHPNEAAAPRVQLDTLPDDVLGAIFNFLDIGELLRCMEVGSGLSARVTSLGIPLYLTRHRQSHLSLFPHPSQWPPTALVRYNHIINRSISQHKWHALQIGRTWPQNVIPTLYVDPEGSRVVLGVGGSLVVHPLLNPNGGGGVGHGRYGGKAAGLAREYPIRTPGTGSRSDVVSIVDLHDGQGSLAIAQFDGQIQRLTLPPTGASIPRITARYPHPRTNSTRIRSVTGSEKGEALMSTTWEGLVSVVNTRSPWAESSTMNVHGKVAWSSLLTTSHPVLAPTAMLGTKTSIDLHPLLSSGLSTTPSRKLCGPDLPQASSPYDIHLPPPSSSHHPALLLSAWYDSHLRLHDLRSSSPCPAQTFQDPYTWADGSAFYSACFVGGNHIAGGGARHGTVAFFDIRNASKGWSCFSPGGKGSPVYALQGEGGRVWGVTERRAFVLAFDGSGDEPDGLVRSEARAVTQRDRDRGRNVPSGWRGRGGKWAWTVRYDVDEGNRAVGYEHKDREIKMFDSLVAA